MSAPPPYPGAEKQGHGPPPPPSGYGPPPPAAGYQPMYGQPAAGYQPGYQPMTAGQSSVTVITQPGIMIAGQQFREHPVRTKCPACQAEVMTSTSFETGTFAWVIALVLCLFGLWLGCCLIPFCVDGCKDVVHSCPNCRHTIGKFNRMWVQTDIPVPTTKDHQGKKWQSFHLLNLNWYFGFNCVDLINWWIIFFFRFTTSKD